MRLSASKKFKAIFAILEKTYGRREKYRERPPVEQALVTVLLKDGKEKPAEQALKRLQQHFVDLNEMRVCEGELLDEFLGRGTPPGVGQLLRDTLTAIFNHAQAMNLDDVMVLAPEKAEAKLKKLNPLPSRVAAELLLANLKYPKLPEAAGMLRVARRTKLISGGAVSAQATSLRRLVPKTKIPQAVHAFETLAERVCTPKDFQCRACPIQEYCPTGAETLHRLAVQEEKERAAKEAEERRRRRKRDRERKARARKKAATERLKQTIQDRSKQLKISPTKKRRRRTKPTVPTGTKMVQASSAVVKSDAKKTPRRKTTRKRPSRASKPRK